MGSQASFSALRSGGLPPPLGNPVQGHAAPGTCLKPTQHLTANPSPATSPCGGCHMAPSSLPSPSSLSPPCRPRVAVFWHWDRRRSVYEVFEQEGVPAPSLQCGSLQDDVCGLPLRYTSHLHKPLLPDGCCGPSRTALTRCSAPRHKNKAKPQATKNKRCLQ